MKLDLDFREIIEFSNRLQSAHELETALMTATQNIARVLHKHILKNTPIDTGNLRKMWSAGDNLLFTVEKVQNGYQVTLVNTARRDDENGYMYGVAVNDGHRTPGGGGWVMGRFFVEASINEVKSSAQLESIIYKELEKWFRWCMNGK